MVIRHKVWHDNIKIMSNPLSFIELLQRSSTKSHHLLIIPQPNIYQKILYFCILV
jgi:hypothetical protein